MKTLTLIIATLFVAVSHAREGTQSATELHWYRGNTHAHTQNSDGNAPASTVARWYRDNGFQFLFITDHEFITDADPLNESLGSDGQFLVLEGQEVTQSVLDVSNPTRTRLAHVNALGTSRVVTPISSAEGGAIAQGLPMSEVFRRNINEIRLAGGIPQIAHPNAAWSVRPEDLSAITGPVLLEVLNGAHANNMGGVDDDGKMVLSTEALWDVLLTQGKTVWAVGCDDAHDYLNFQKPRSLRPGTAWIVIRAPALTSSAVLGAISRGEFYASDGVNIESYVVNDHSISIKIEEPMRVYGVRARNFMTRFIGQGGRVLAEVSGLNPSYVYRGGEGYVRASITDSNGQRALLQPVFLKKQ
jgi:hypothetical protein